MVELAIQEIEGGVVFSAKIVPGSSKTSVSGLLGDMIKIKIAAAPEKGKANECLVEFLAKQLNVKKNAVVIVSGQTNPIKQIKVLGLAAEVVLEKLGLR